MSLKDKLKTAAGITLAGLGLTALVGCATNSTPTHYQPVQQANRSYDGPRFFACKDTVDQNNNNSYDFPEDFPGVNSMFRANENVYLISVWTNKKGGTVKTKIIGPDNSEEQVGGDDYVSSDGFAISHSISFIVPGIYKVEYFYNGSYAGGNEIDIINPIISQ